MNDLATAALDHVSRMLMIDDKWSVRGERELTWTGHRLGQTYSVAGPFESRGMPVYRISATVPLIAAPACEDIERSLSVLNHICVGGALVWHPGERVLKSHIAAVFHEETLGWRLSQFTSFAIVQLALLEARLEMIAHLVRGEPIIWGHPENGPRTNLDDMLNVARDVYQPRGEEPSRFLSPEEFKAVWEWTRETPFFSMGASETGLAIEVPFGSRDTSLIRLWADQEHPTLGSGLLVSIQVRPSAPSHDLPMEKVAAGLNLLETGATISLHQYGAWHASERIVAHSHFIPNVDYQRGVIMDAALGAIGRAEWAAEMLHPPGHEDGPYDAAWIASLRFLDQLGGGAGWAEA
jgi:hypothetical protein